METQTYDRSALEAGSQTIYFLDELNFTWKLVLSLEKAQANYKARFSIENGIFDEPFKYRIVLKHPSEYTKDIVLEFIDEFYEGFGITILVGKNKNLEEQGFFENGEKLDLKFSVEPVNKMRCLLLWNKILAERNNLQMQPELLTKMEDEIKELKQKNMPFCSVYLNLVRQGEDTINECRL